jgi:predicted site-specific integrase-resolvase
MEAKMTVREIVAETGISFAHAYNMVRSGRFQGAEKRDGQWRIPADSLSAYLRRRKKQQENAKAA